jgi:polysaccharide export outer membrane protein
MRDRRLFCATLGVACLIALTVSGCVFLDGKKPSPNVEVPRELRTVSLPPYVIEPPDILLIDTLRTIPKPPYKVEPLDILLIQATDVLPASPVAGNYGVDPNGMVNLGIPYGGVRVAGLTLEEAQKALERHLQSFLKVGAPPVRVTVNLSQGQAMQQIRGEHLVRPDGTIGLGNYGSVYVSGLTLAQAQFVIQEHLSRFLQEPKISLDIFSYNSKFYYIVMDGAGYGQRIFRLPVTGKETVLDAMSQIYGLQGVSSKKHIWLARPNGGNGCDTQIFPIDWMAVTKCGSPVTNYQLMAGDRIYIAGDTLIETNNILTKFFAPFERIFGVTLLGTSTVQQIESLNLLFQEGASAGVGVITSR